MSHTPIKTTIRIRLPNIRVVFELSVRPGSKCCQTTIGGEGLFAVLVNLNSDDHHWHLSSDILTMYRTVRPGPSMKITRNRRSSHTRDRVTSDFSSRSSESPSSNSFACLVDSGLRVYFIPEQFICFSAITEATAISCQMRGSMV
jgi:hypothetical protein